MNILVTGGAGFIGSNIADKLIELGHIVVIVDNLSSGKKENINSKAVFHKLDISCDKLDEVFNETEVDYVIHHAAQTDVNRSVNNVVLDLECNIKGTVNILENCRKYGVEKVIYASSAAVYGEPDYLPVDEKHPVRPLSPYGISKFTPEHYIKAYKELYGLKYTIFRYSNVYGPRQDPSGEGGVISIFIDQMMAGKTPVIYGDGEQTRDFIHVYDIVEANVKALESGDEQLINISTNTKSSVNDLYQILNKILNTEIKPLYKEARKGDIKHSYLDNTLAKKIINWQPEYDLESGLKQTVGYYTAKRG